MASGTAVCISADSSDSKTPAENLVSQGVLVSPAEDLVSQRHFIEMAEDENDFPSGGDASQKDF